jgi:hypothetical protein
LNTTEFQARKSLLNDIIFGMTKISVDLFRAAPYMPMLALHKDGLFHFGITRRRILPILGQILIKLFWHQTNTVFFIKIYEPKALILVKILRNTIGAIYTKKICMIRLESLLNPLFLSWIIFWKKIKLFSVVKWSNKFTVFLVNWVPGQGLEQRESRKTYTIWRLLLYFLVILL